MLEAGILRDGEALELIDGLLIYRDRSARGGDPKTIGEKHNLVIKLLARLEADLEGLGAQMQTQGPVRLSETNEPEPDGAVVRGGPRDCSARVPAGADVESIIEVADSSLEYDRSTKAAMYARAGLAQYVIVNVRDARIEVLEQPAEGTYTLSRVIFPDGSVELRAPGGKRLLVAAARLLP